MSMLQTPPTRVTDTPPGAAVTGLRRRRSTPHLLLGVLLVVMCALAFAVTGLRVDPRSEVLALSHTVQAGHVLSDADLTVVHIVPDPALGVLTQAQRSSVLGHSVRLPLAAHSLLSQDLLGPAGWPPPGQSLIAVSVKTGHAPAGLSVGLQVLVLVVPASSATATGGQASATVPQAPAAVYAVGPADNAGTTVVSLLISASSATRITSAPGDAVLIVQGGAG